MSLVKQLVSSLLSDIYGKQQQYEHCEFLRESALLPYSYDDISSGIRGYDSITLLIGMKNQRLIDVKSILNMELHLMGFFLEKLLITRDELRQNQDRMCEFATALLYVINNDANAKMRFSLTPPATKASFVLKTPATATIDNEDNYHSPLASSHCNELSSMQSNSTFMQAESATTTTTTTAAAAAPIAATNDDDAISDYHQWLHAMKLVARLPGGMPPEFRRKLWLSLADKYLKSKNVDWPKEEEKCFCEKWREDDEELGIQIVKDLHRTGSNLCTGPAGSINQAKLKRILLGYARYNPQVGYCQGFNMLGALILQVMDKEEAESIKVMIYLVEGVLPSGYFCGSMGGLQADMGVFRELMQMKLPRLAKHLQKLQGPIENAYEPPLTNVFTMQWFLTMFCTCLPMTCVLRVWDLVLIEGSDVILRTALVLWSLLEERILKARTADDFYCKMGSFSSELLNGHLIDSNGLIERVVQLGAIPNLQKLRDKHLYHITPLTNKQGLPFYYNDDEEAESDDESKLAVATAWGLPWVRRGSQSGSSKQQADNKDRIALDISLLKKQYDRLRERQKQAHIILTTACSTARQTTNQHTGVPVNQLLMGRPAIISNRGRRIGPPAGTIPPARKPSLPAILPTKPIQKQLRRGETLHWRDTELSQRRRDSLTWKEIKADREQLKCDGSLDVPTSRKLRSRMGKSDSSSYSEESDGEGSSTDTSLCDDDDPMTGDGKAKTVALDKSPLRRSKSGRKQKEAAAKLKCIETNQEASKERIRPKSWAPASNEIPFVLMNSDSPEVIAPQTTLEPFESPCKEQDDMEATCDRISYKPMCDLDWNDTDYSSIAGDLATSKYNSSHLDADVLELPIITRTNQLSPMPDILTFLESAAMCPLPAPKPHLVDSVNSLGSGDDDVCEGSKRKFDVSDAGVTNEYFERVNSVERPTNLDLFYSLNEENDIRNAFKDKYDEDDDDDLEIDFNSELLSDQGYKSEVLPEIETMAAKTASELHSFSEQATLKKTLESEVELNDIYDTPKSFLSADSYDKVIDSLILRDDNIPGQSAENLNMEDDTANINSIDDTFHIAKRHVSNASKKRRDPRRFTLTHYTSIEIEDQQRQHSDQFKNSLTRMKTSTELKKIPSTADLEKRFESIERNFSSATTEHSKTIQLTEQDAESSSSSKRERIPSIADLENRFHALERQMSSKSISPKKSANFREECDNNEEAGDLRDRSNKRRETKEEKSDSKKTEASIKTSKEEDETKSEQSGQHKKLGSTEELDKRFEESERKPSIEKCVPAKQKKEPPDGVKEEKRRETKLTQQTKDDERDSRSTEIEQKQIRKPPPSTEELEKRFNAMERQLSSATLEKRDNLQDNARKLRKATTIDIANSKTVTKRKTTTPPNTPDAAVTTNAINDELAKQSKLQEIKRSNEEKVTKVTSNEKPEKLRADLDRNETTNLSSASETDHCRRRASEPPTTANLEKRYEDLKREKSSRALIDSATLEENETKLDKTKEKLINESVDDDRIIKTAVHKQTDKAAPPTTEELESRYEALQNKKPTQKRLKKQITSQTDDKYNEQTKDSSQYSNTESRSLIPQPPPLPETRSDTDLNFTLSDDKQRRALITEFQSKIQTPPNGDNIKPSIINPNRKTPSSASIRTAQKHKSADETLETHAKFAFLCESEKGELCYMHTNRMVRRFSDLPSRADLENRVQFLEKQLHAKFYKQRSASDSEVASRAHFAAVERKLTQKLSSKETAIEDATPSTSQFCQSAEELEKRVQLLEKQLSENSLKLLETMRTKSKVELDQTHNASPRRLSNETIDASGKELVRYAHYDDMDNTELHKPINISINIKMLLNKDEEPKEKPICLATTEEWQRRLEAIEIQLKERHIAIAKDRFDEETLNKQNDIKEDADNMTSTSQNVSGTEVEKESQLKTQTEEDKSMASCELREDIKQSPDKIAKGLNRNTEKPNAAEEIEATVLEQESKDDIKSEENNEKRATEIDTNDCKKLQKASKYEKAVEAVEVNPKQANNECKTKEDSDHVANIADTEAEKPQSVDKCKEQTEVLEQNASNEKTKQNTTNSDKTLKCATPDMPSKIIIHPEDIKSTDPKKPMVLLLDNEPKALKVRRLTRANTEELEGLFQALEKQLSERNLIKQEDGKLKHADEKPTEEQIAITDLTKQIAEFTNAEDKVEVKQAKKTPTTPKATKIENEADDYDWGPDPIKRHLKRKTAYLPSTKELVARFRSLERQIKLLEDVEKIDVTQRLNEIERKIKLQYSLSHEKDLNKFLELCDGKGLDDMPLFADTEQAATPTKTQSKIRSPHQSPARVRTTATSPARNRSRSPHTSAARKRSPYTSPARELIDDKPTAEDRYRSLDLPRSKSKENFKRTNKAAAIQKQPIHPIEMLLDPTPDEDNDIPTTGELEHRFKVLNEKTHAKTPTRYEYIDKVSPPTEQELEARVQALEQARSFDYKTQRNFKEFNQKLKEVISPALSFEEYATTKSREPSPKRRPTTPKSALRETEPRHEERAALRSTSPKVIRFREHDQLPDKRPVSSYEWRSLERPTMVGNDEEVMALIQENTKTLERILKQTITDAVRSSSPNLQATTTEGLDEMGSRLMRETSPLRRTGTHTGVPLRTDDNINDRLSSIKNTIKSIDTLCEEKPYRKERCQRYIDSICTDSLHFGSKKSSLEDLTRNLSRSYNSDYAPAIRISDHCQRPSEYYRSTGSADSIRTSSPLRAASPLHHRSNRDIRRDVSPRRRRYEEEREENESRLLKKETFTKANRVQNDKSVN